MKVTVLVPLFPLCGGSCEAVKRCSSLSLGEFFRGGEGKGLLQKENCNPELCGYFDRRILVLETQPGLI